jgi:hypothetical protein
MERYLRYAASLALVNAGHSIQGMLPLVGGITKANDVVDPAEAERRARIARAWAADPGPALH